MAESWTIEDLNEELRQFESELRAAKLAEASVRTYVDRSATFIRWLTGVYHPQGPRL
ncbi:MAG: hypothetical protein M3454_08980 [Actinomycetota bacterium]|nr:hypothetical protein [Actinomycetota bacterium]